MKFLLRRRRELNSIEAARVRRIEGSCGINRDARVQNVKNKNKQDAYPRHISIDISNPKDTLVRYRPFKGIGCLMEEGVGHCNSHSLDEGSTLRSRSAKVWYPTFRAGLLSRSSEGEHGTARTHILLTTKNYGGLIDGERRRLTTLASPRAQNAVSG
ncbi:hypothetical protein EVAR_61251_1 [Eumeta japonica]|uniref:Uncharacterized protein n=1 Tax=Eumeta variegata TaxID=151549 RepID=A0A4C1Z893_EUMVA|nr:hypothetical protein EVAR_61251_1 [Eumeta japonica]